MPGPLFALLIEVYLIYSIVLVSGVQSSDNLQDCVHRSTRVCIYMHIASVVVAHGLSSCRSRALDHRLSSCGLRAYCPEARRIVPYQGLNLCLLHGRLILYYGTTREALDHNFLSPGPQLFRCQYVLLLLFKWILQP